MPRSTLLGAYGRCGLRNPKCGIRNKETEPGNGTRQINIEDVF